MTARGLEREGRDKTVKMVALPTDNSQYPCHAAAGRITPVGVLPLFPDCFFFLLIVVMG